MVTFYIGNHNPGQIRGSLHRGLGGFNACGVKAFLGDGIIELEHVGVGTMFVEVEEVLTSELEANEGPDLSCNSTTHTTFPKSLESCAVQRDCNQGASLKFILYRFFL